MSKVAVCKLDEIRMFGSSTRKILIHNFDGLLHSFENSVLDDGVDPPDHDAAVMFLGWLHFAMGRYASKGKLGGSDYAPLVQAAAEAIDRVLPAHGLPDTYFSDTKKAAQDAFNQLRPGDHVVKWIPIYYRSQQLAVSEEIFAGALARETMAVLQS